MTDLIQGDELIAEIRQQADQMSAAAERYFQWADELDADGCPRTAEIARWRAAAERTAAAEYETLIRYRTRLLADRRLRQPKIPRMRPDWVRRIFARILLMGGRGGGDG